MLKRMKRKAPVEEDPTSSEDETSSQGSDDEVCISSRANRFRNDKVISNILLQHIFF